MLTEKDQIKALKELESLKAEIKVLHKWQNLTSFLTIFHMKNRVLSLKTFC